MTREIMFIFSVLLGIFVLIGLLYLSVEYKLSTIKEYYDLSARYISISIDRIKVLEDKIKELEDKINS